MPVSLRALPDEAAIRALQARGATLLESWDWQDVGAEVHKQEFTVAKSAGFDILGDLHSSLQDALADGETFQSWAKRIRPTLAEKGWWGRKELTDPLTGEVREVQLGSTRRLRTIYDTNMRVSHAQGKWERIERLADRRPWLRYVAVLDECTRASHRQWHGTVLRWDDPFWDTHYPPNGWRCRCTVMQVGAADLKRYGWQVNDSPSSSPQPPRLWRNPRTGETTEVPPGIDPGWAHNPGKRPSVATQAVTKLAPLPPPVAAQAPIADPGLIPQLAKEHSAWVDDVVSAGRATGERRPVGVLSEKTQGGLERIGQAPSQAVVSLSDRSVLHWLRDAKSKATTRNGLPKALGLDDLRRLPTVLAAPEAVLWDTHTKSVLYIFTPSVPEPRKAKAVVTLDYIVRHRGQTQVLNEITTGGYDTLENLRSDRFVLLEGELM